MAVARFLDATLPADRHATIWVGVSPKHLHSPRLIRMDHIEVALVQHNPNVARTILRGLHSVAP